MPDENQEAEEQEIAQVVPPTESNDSADEKQKAEKFAKKSDEYHQRNWTETRRKMQELERKAKEQDELISQLRAPKQPAQEDELDQLGDEDILNKRQARRLATKMAEEIAQKIIRERENSTVDERLNLKFQDFSQVVNRENIELLKETEPELAMTLAQNTDQYSQGIAAYKLLKRLGIGAEEMPKEHIREKQKAITNSQKPLSVNAVSKTSAIGNAHLFENGLTKDLKKSLYEEMVRASKGF